MTFFRRNLGWQIAVAGLVAMLCSSGCASRLKTQKEPAATSAPVENKAPLAVETFDAAWKIIYDTHFDTNFNGVDWTAVRAELRPKAEATRNVTELRSIIDSMLGKLGQSHMSLIPREVAVVLDAAKGRERSDNGSTGKTEVIASKSTSAAEAEPNQTDDQETASASASGAGHVGFDVRLVDQRLVVTRVDADGPAQKAGVRPGWILQSIGDRRVSEPLGKLARDVDSRQLPFMAWRLVKAQLSGRTGSTVRLEFLDESDHATSVTLTRTPAPGDPVKFGFLPRLYVEFHKDRLKAADGADVGLIGFNIWMIPISAQFDKAVEEFRQADGIVIDLRGNLGGLGGMVMGLSGHFLKDRISLGTMKTRGNELQFFSNPRFTNPSGQRTEPYSGPVAILIDGISLSAAEIFAGGMQAVGRARVFGDRSPGQALPALWDKLPNGDVLYHAFADFVTPTGVRLEGRGVSPDELVRLTREDLLAGRDPALLAAMRWIGQQRAKKTSVTSNAESNEAK